MRGESLDRQVFGELTEIPGISIREMNLSLSGEKRIAFEVDGRPESLIGWDYFCHQLSERCRGIRIHREGNRHVFVFSSSPEREESQLACFLRCLAARYWMIPRPASRHMTVIFKSTNRCNMSCSYCYDKPFRDAIGHIGHLDLGSVDRFFSMARDYTEELDLVWHGGEPLMAGIDYYRQVYGEILPRYPQLQVNSSIQTNGTLIDDGWIDFFLAHGISVGTSYQAYGWDIRSRGIPDDVVIRNIMKAREKKLRMGVIDVLTKDDPARLRQKYEFYKSIDTHVCFNEVFEAGAAGHDMQLERTRESEGHVMDYFRYWVNDRDGMDDRFASLYLHVIGGAGDGVCHFSSCVGNYISINSNGDLYPCDRPYMEKYRIGNVMDFGSFSEVYGSDVYRNYRDEVRAKRNDFCSGCEVRSMCCGGCPLLDIDMHGTAATANADACAARKMHMASMFRVLCEVTDIDACNRELSRWVRQYSRFLPCEILEVARRLGIGSVVRAFAEEQGEDCLSGEAFSIFRAFNPDLRRGGCSPVTLPAYADRADADFMTDGRRLALLGESMKHRYEEIRGKLWE